MNLNTTYIFAVVGIAFLISAAFAMVIARTAKSKGYKYGWFFFFGFISYLLTSVVAVFIRPKGQPNAKPKVSSVVLLILGIVVEFSGLANLPELDNTLPESEAIQQFMNDPQLLGGLLVAIAGIFIIMGSVANDYRSNKEEVRSL